MAAPRRFASTSALVRWRSAPIVAAGPHQSRCLAVSSAPKASASTSAIPPQAPNITLPPPVPKPPTSTWYTGSPSLTSLRRDLDSLTHRTRHLLFASRILTRYASEPNFSGTGIRLRFLRWKALGVGTADGKGDPVLRDLLRQVSWKNREDFELALEESAKGGGGAGGRKRLKISTYRELTKQLSELRQLQLYVHYALSLGGVDDTRALRMVGEEIAEVVSRFGKLGRDLGERRGLKLERDAYGRYAGIGRKKEATARGWMVEVVHPHSTKQDEAAKPQVVKAEDAMPPVGRVLVNGRPLSEYFEDPQQRAIVLQPFMITRTIGLYNLHLLVHGSGHSSQAHACAAALSQCLLKALGDRSDEGVATLGGIGEAERRWGRKSLVRSNLAKRDPRVVERKKTGRKGARARYTWVKR